MSPIAGPRRVGFTIIELLLVVATLAVVFAIALPRMSVVRENATLRAGRQQLTAAFSAARAAALQKGRTATITLEGNTATVTVRSGLAAAEVRVFGPVRLDSTLNVTLEPLGGAPRVINYNARGMLMNVMGQSEEVFRYQLSHGSVSDTLCVTTAGIVLSRHCIL